MEEWDERITRIEQANGLRSGKKAEIAGEDLASGLRRIMELLKKGEKEGKVIIIRKGDDIPLEIIADTVIEKLGVTFPDVESERDKTEKNAKKIFKKLEKATEENEERFELPLLTAGQGSEGYKSLTVVRSLWNSTKALRDSVTAMNFGPGITTNLLVEVAHATCFDIHRIVYEAFLTAKFLDMGTASTKLTKPFIMEVVKRRCSEEQKYQIIQQEIQRMQQDAHMRNQEQLMRRYVGGGRATGAYEHRQESRGGFQGRGRGRRSREGQNIPSSSTTPTMNNPQPRVTGGNSE